MRPVFSSLVRSITTLCVCLLLLAGCGEDNDPETISGDFGSSGKELAEQVEDAAQTETGKRFRVTCPNDVGMSDGDYVDCRAKVGGNTSKVRVTREGSIYRWRLYDFLDPEKVEDEIERSFKSKRDIVVTAECQRVPIEQDRVSRCTASTAQREYRIRVRQTDDVGGIRWDVEER